MSSCATFSRQMWTLLNGVFRKWPRKASLGTNNQPLIAVFSGSEERTLWETEMNIFVSCFVASGCLNIRRTIFCCDGRSLHVVTCQICFSDGFLWFAFLAVSRKDFVHEYRDHYGYIYFENIRGTCAFSCCMTCWRHILVKKLLALQVHNLYCIQSGIVETLQSFSNADSTSWAGSPVNGHCPLRFLQFIQSFFTRSGEKM